MYMHGMLSVIAAHGAIEFLKNILLGAMVIKKTETALSFDWLKQLRLYWDDNIEDCNFDCCDARFLYGYEYVGKSVKCAIWRD